MAPARCVIRCFVLWTAFLVPIRSAFALVQIDEDVFSPDGRVWVNVSISCGGLHYAVQFNRSPVIEPSRLSFTVDGVDLTRGAAFGNVQRYQVDETYAWRGGHSVATNRCNGARIPFTVGAGGAAFVMEVRAFNDGAAFRFIAPGQAGQKRVPDEATTFLLPAGSTVWYHGLGGHYEDTYDRKDVAALKEGEWAAPPVTYKLPAGAGYASITEAALLNYAGMALQADGRCGLVAGLGHRHPINYPFRLRYGEEEHARLSKPAAVEGTITTPWRVVLVGTDLGALVNSDVLHNLCPPPDPELFPKGSGTDWVRPGRAVWKYLDGGQNTLEEMKHFSRLAGELGFEHNVIEGFWRRWSGEELRGLVAYAKQRNVGTWLWRHTKELRTPEARAEFFALCRDAGVAGVKLDFFDHEAKEVVDLYETLLREAARHRLMVNFHGANKPTGLARTYPNELTREAVRGMESSRLQERARHNTILPFTRFLAGHADYTPVHFGARRGDTTAAHQVATAAVFDSSLLTYAAHPAKLLEHPAAEMIRSIPATWDQTVVLPPSEIGEVAAFARRSGDRWFLAVLNGPAPRTAKFPLTFLGAGDYDGLLVRDPAGDPAAVEVQRRAGRSEDTLQVAMPAGGGFVARFTAARPAAPR